MDADHESHVYKSMAISSRESPCFESKPETGNSGSLTNEGLDSSLIKTNEALQPDIYLKSVSTHLPNSCHSERSLHSLIAESNDRTLDENFLLEASVCPTTLQHPTPDLQTLQGAYAGTVEHLERTAERLSITSTIEDAIQKLHDKQRQPGSRRSSSSSYNKPAHSHNKSDMPSIIEQSNTTLPGDFSPVVCLESLEYPVTTPQSARIRTYSKGSGIPRSMPENSKRQSNSSANEPNLNYPPSLYSNTKAIPNIEDVSVIPTRPTTDTIESYNTGNITGTGHENESSKQTQELGSPVKPGSEIVPTDIIEKMFANFDGIHSEQSSTHKLYDSVGSEKELKDATKNKFLSSVTRDRMSTSSIGVDPQSYTDPTTGHQMVYYPAPVPIMLNLPQKLSNKPPSASRFHRRSQVDNMNGSRQNLSYNTAEISAAEAGEESHARDFFSQNYTTNRASIATQRITRDLANLPPQLRASTFFETQSSPTPVVQLKDQSAVATLDSILDASAHAPVSAFTDHAFAGALGPEVYGKKIVSSRPKTSQVVEPPKKRVSSFGGLFFSRKNKSGGKIDPTKNQVLTISPSAQEDHGNEEDSNLMETINGQESETGGSLLGEPNDENHDDEHVDELYENPPTTLLAELHLRKQRQKQRTQPLTKTFPNGIHSTLLELDTAIQTEQKSRRKFRTVLAWEDPMALEAEAAMQEDDEVPLAMLYSMKAAENRPLGLLERRELEDNEPLSQRRNRLQGRNPASPRVNSKINIPSPFSIEEKEETLGDRAKRLKASSGNLASPLNAGENFSNGVLGQFGGNTVEPKPQGNEKSNTSPRPGDEEETLGQRRKRLQAEQENKTWEQNVNLRIPSRQTPKPDLQNRRSMADILAAHPTSSNVAQKCYDQPIGGLLAMHEKQVARRSACMHSFDVSSALHNSIQKPSLTHQSSTHGFKAGLYNDGNGGGGNGGMESLQVPYGSGGFSNQMALQPPNSGYLAPQNALSNMTGLSTNMNFGANCTTNPITATNIPANLLGFTQNSNMNIPPITLPIPQPPQQGQIDMIERWRQNVMPSTKPTI
ncbi:hypothetical protein BGHDH14_bgh01688 [Blumeria hordei DH14]|uniref:Uncharacterized protein n=1 Tax=Blumeria graminis f. sp. hordei (strain DH14) TaxID=546991 RepID=N1J668_BLUG1|nr:hypothetical protein BGHDH14_bgh01688 [Blumeria hordei DH14]